MLGPLFWGPHLENHWQREVFLEVNWGEPGLSAAPGTVACVEGEAGIYLTLLVCRASSLTLCCSQGSTRGLRDAAAAANDLGS